MGKKYQYKKIVLGGTFDHFHKGHQRFLEKAFGIGEKILIGITSDEMVKDKFLSHSIESFSKRKENVYKFLIKKNWREKANLTKISDFTGGVEKLKKVEGIVVSKNTYVNALKINDFREKNGLKKLRIIVVPDILASDSNIISSERIRAGEIDREGKSYWLFVISYLENKKKLILPESLKEELRKPLGKVFYDTSDLVNFINEKKPEFIFSVGDIVSYHLMKNKINPLFLIFDFKTKRGEVDEKVKKVIGSNFSNKIVNQPGTISKEAFIKIKNCVKKILTKKQKQTIFVNGEEDLLALPVILFSPLNSLILYGHWQLGVVGLVSDERMKKKVIGLLKKFTS